MKNVHRGLALMAILLAIAPAALGSTTWYVDGVNGNDGNGCKSATTACKTIGHAISLASSGDSISVAAATYTENLTISISLKITGSGASTTIIDGGGVNTVVTVPSGSSQVALSGLTVRNGLALQGGGIYNAGRLSITNSTISGNTAFYTCPSTRQSFGGGIYNEGTLALNHSTLSENTATGHNQHFCVSKAYGGGISNSGALTLGQCILNGNSSNYSGGGISNWGTVQIKGSTLIGNSAGFSGGGIDMWSGSLTVDLSVVSGNLGEEYGGGIDTWAGKLTINNSTFASNSSYNFGGGLDNSGTMTISKSTLSSNSASISGGGIYNGGTAIINNSTVTGSPPVGAGGGGIENLSALTINNSTITGNGASGCASGMTGLNPLKGCSGGGNIDGTATLQNTIVANATSGGNCSSTTTLTSNGYNLSSDGTCNFSGPGDLNNTDPKLGTLGNYGGSTQTIPLLNGSPAIDAGNPNGCTDGNGHLLKTDQRGAPRPDKEDTGGCDMGAFEKQSD